MPTNTAAWLPAKHARLEVGPAPYTPPAEGEIVVENHAVAINPLDWILQLVGNVIFRWIDYPFVLGADLAGEVVEVGAGVSRFQVGDRVLAHAVGTDNKRNRAAARPRAASSATPSCWRTWQRRSPARWRTRTPPSCPSGSRPQPAGCSRPTTWG